MPDLVAPDAHAAFQYSGPKHQTDTAISGMWLFLATEMLFFGALFAVWTLYRFSHSTGFGRAAQETDLLIGSLNTALLVTSSLAFTWGLSRARLGDNRGLLRACLITFLLGAAFVILKGVEWGEDFSKHLWPGPAFALSGSDSGGARLFYVFYFIGTALHALHMMAGLGLVAWLALRAQRAEFSPTYNVPVEIVGLYWSFVDIVWMILYPLIYLAARK